MAAELALIVPSIARPVAPPPAALMSLLTSAAGILPGGYVAACANSNGFAPITASCGANFCELAICVGYFKAIATMFGCVFAKTSCDWYCVASATILPCVPAQTKAGYWAE